LWFFTYLYLVGQGAGLNRPPAISQTLGAIRFSGFQIFRMSRKLKISLIFIGSLIVLFAIARITNILQLYKASSSANYPTLKPGQWFFASSIVKPKRFSLICYRWNDDQNGSHVRVHRLCGVEGDTVEMRDGELLINGKHIDSNIDVAHLYFLNEPELEKVKQFENSNNDDLYVPMGDSFLVTLSDKTVIDHSIKARRKLLLKNYADPAISAKFLTDWNQDHFGPLVVPERTYFLLGDNRHGSEDSRYLGFIDKSRFVGTVIGK
jgi:signal peptidase I